MVKLPGVRTIQRPKRLLLALLLLAASAQGHNLPGVHPLAPGRPFTLLALKALLPDGKGHYAVGRVDFPSLRGDALAFLIVDPDLAVDAAEAHRFQRLARRLRHTRAFLVAPPQRSQNPAALAKLVERAGFTLPVLVDDRDVFPYLFGHPLGASPRYELFDRSFTLVVQNAARLSQQLPTGDLVAAALRRLDAGQPVEGVAVLPSEARGR